ncbi:hypothetical protein [Metallibacterium sp.]|uniref:hypothetical protein n=1 Tax=Metallibacterium sp. TaxID=2940281 RepID=UPI002631F2EE|nr:hypothetical protein [Metallibacterium sp.]
MARPRVPALSRIANQLWLQAVVHAAKAKAAESTVRFSLSKLAGQLLTLGADEADEFGAERDRLQALVTIRRTGSDPAKCVRVVQPDDVPERLGADCVEVFPRQRSHPTGKPRMKHRKRYFRIDAVARAEQLYPGTVRWYQPVLFRTLTPPALSLDQTRSRLALELAKLGYVRSPLIAHLAAVRRYLGNDSKDDDEEEKRMWTDRLAPISDLGTIEAAGALALLLHDARLSYAPEHTVCDTICDALIGTVFQLLNEIGADEAIGEVLAHHIHERLLLQRWQEDVDSREPLFLGTPLSLEEWAVVREKHPRMNAISTSPYLPADPDNAARTIAALHDALARIAPDATDPDRPSVKVLQKVGLHLSRTK